MNNIILQKNMKTRQAPLLFILSFLFIPTVRALCSIYCPVSACNGTAYNLCQSCDEVFALNSSMSPNCQPYPPTNFVYEASSDSGLTVNYPSSTLTDCSSITNIKGWFDPADSFQVTYPGVTRPYQSIKILFGVVSRGSWNGPQQFQITFQNTGEIVTRSVFSRDYGLTGKCSSDNTDYRYRIIQNSVYTTQNTQLTWNFKLINLSGGIDGQWGITQVLLLLNSCDRKCLTCTTSTTTCTSCVTSGTYESFLVSSSSSCVDAPSCPTSTYASSATHVCQNCNSSNCLKCSTINVCTLCATGFYLYSVNSSCFSTCPTGYYGNSSLSPPGCSQCSNQCAACTSNVVCSACTTSGTYQSYLNGSSCISGALCPSGTYPEITTHICTTCNSSCLTCQGTVNNCTSCISTLFYKSNICYSTCPNGFFGNSTTGNCQSCNSKCTICAVISTNCSACTTSGVNQSYLTGTSCVASSSCPAGTYPESATHVCTTCNTSCITCQGTINNCTSCISTLFYLTNICYSTCPNGYFGNSSTGNCELCNSRCTLCSILSTNCTACTTSGVNQSYLTGTSCVASSSCPAGTYPESATHICTSCNTSCITCQGTINNCTSCISTLFYLTNICYSTCPNGYFGNASTGNCQLCNSRCTLCSVLSTNCTACTTSGVNESYLTGTSCVVSSSCPAGTYPEPTTHVCTSCNTSCLTCQINPDNCTSCISTLFYMLNVCYSTCPNGYFGNSSTGKCELCNSRCTLCSILSTNCSACTTSGVNQSYLTGTSCVVSTSCPSDTYPEPSTHICTTCNTSCATCVGNVDNCTSCVLGLFYLTNICYINCPSPYFNSAAALKQCLLCDARCTVCNVSSTNCSACTISGASQSYLTGTSCVVSTSCPAGTYPEPSTHICTSCNTSCATCVGNADNCTSCILGLYYLSNICYTVCPDPYYNSAQAVKQCLLCNSRCTICNVSSTNCSACTTSGAFQSFLNTLTSTCVVNTSCPIGYFANFATHKCEICNTSCYTCQFSTDNCTWCSNPLYLLNSICYTVCPLTYYGNAGKCILCDSHCVTCTGTLISQCLSCQTSGPFQSYFQAANTTCYTDCPMGYYEIVVNHTCTKCDISCSSCTNSPSPCQSCNSSYAYFNETCLSPCPDGYWAAPIANLTYKVCQPCVVVCLTCYGGLDSQCYTCNFDYMVKKSGSYCRANCLSGWGDILDSQYCAYCNPRCVSCYNNGNNCTSCKTSGGNEGFMIIADTLANTGNCYNPCPNGYFANYTTHFCDNCTSPCKTCTSLTSKCTSCITGYYYLNYLCYAVCPDGYYINGLNCSKCNPQCSLCNISSSNCSLCNPSFPAYLLNLVCYANCPDGYFANPGILTTNYTCQKCSDECKTCSWDPNPCFSCNPYYFYFNLTCNSTCTIPGYFGDIVTWQCALCDQRCVRMDLKMQFQNILQQAILVTFTFTEDLDWSTFPMQSFQYFQFDNSFFTVDMFNYDFTILDSRSYQIKITPKLYIFMYDLKVSVIVMPMPVPNFQAINKRPFHQSIYNQTKYVIWWHIKAPDHTDTQKQMIIDMMTLTSQLQQFTNSSGVREIVQSGILAWFLPGVQITSATVLVNGVMPQHMYEGIRIMATGIFYQVPRWEKGAKNARYIFSDPIQNLVNSTLSRNLFVSSLQGLNQTSFSQYGLIQQNIRRRSLQQTNLPDDWRFKRTGFSTFFILDIYMQIILIAVVWVILLIFIKGIYRKDKTHVNVGRVFIAFHKIHELSLMYVTIALVLEWLYFNKQAEQGYRWASFIICFVLLAYFLLYQLYIYYDLFQYPSAHINTRSYLMFVTRYGCFLSKIRFQQYDVNAKWSPKIWFRPYNYHILSFYKKFMMMFALPIFHQLPYLQASALIALQVLEIARFCITWPFNSKFRNLYRIFLEVVLLLIFIIVLVCQHLSYLLMQNNPDNIQTVVYWFNIIGWIGFALVLVFNFSVFIINFIDLIKLCIKGNHLVQMDQIRQDYFWQKVKKYEDQNQDVKVQIISQWVKHGNLNQSQSVHDESKYITIKVQKLKIQKTSNFYTTHITHVSDLRIREEGFIYQQNSRRLKINNKIRKFMEVSEQKDKQFYELFNQIYKKYNIEEKFKKGKQQYQPNMLQKIRDREKFQVIIETYVKVNLNQYPDGGKVLFYKSLTSHVIHLFINEYKVQKIKVKDRIEGLPLSNKLLAERHIYKKKNKDVEEEQNINQ